MGVYLPGDEHGDEHGDVECALTRSEWQAGRLQRGGGVR
jgi:hypothetical protein